MKLEYQFKRFVSLHFIIESYFEDYTDASNYFFDDDEQDTFYAEMKAGAESGWDYSTKW